MQLVLAHVVDPVEELGLVRLKVRLLHEQGPHLPDVLHAQARRHRVLLVLIVFLGLHN